MTDQIKRTPAGVPTGGQFASHDRPEGASVADPRANRLVTNFDLQPGDVLICQTAMATVQNIEASKVMKGCMAVETELGTLYLDAEGESFIVADGVKVGTVHPQEPIDDDTFLAALGRAQRDGLIIGENCTRDSVESDLQSIFDDVDDDVLDAAGVEDLDSEVIDAVWARVRVSDTWEYIERKGWSAGSRDDLYDEASVALDAYLAERAEARSAA